MNVSVATVLLILSAVSCCTLGGIVVSRNPWKRTHRHFAVLSLNLAGWALGVLFITKSHSPATALFWVRITFMVASFLPATFYHFIVYLPNQRFDGSRTVLRLLYLTALAQVAGTLTPWYVTDIQVQATQAPLVRYGPVFASYLFTVLVSMLFSFTNLFKKLRESTDIERRQIEHVLVGIVATTTLASATNVLAPVLKVGSLEAYGPCFTVLMMGIMAYAMVRYHLMDIWFLVSRTTIYAIVTSFVVGTFLGTVSLVHWVFSGGGREAGILTTVLAALVVSLILQPLKERVQLIVERSLIKRRYNVHRLCARITQNASQIVRLDHLLETVARDIETTMGARAVRVMLIDEKDASLLATEYSSVQGEAPIRTRDHQPLIEYLKEHPEPLVLKKLLHERRDNQHVTLARHLANLNAYVAVPLCASSGIVGVLTASEKDSGDIYSADDLVVFATISGPLGTAIENARLYFRLEKVNLHLARIMASMPSGVVAVDAQGRITTINTSARDLLGNVQVGDDLNSLHPEVANALRETLVEAHGVSDFETVLLGIDGESIPVIMSTSCLESPGVGNYGALAMIHNQQQIKRLEQRVLRADRLSSIGTLAAGMAHEVKNPLVSIKTFTQLLPKRFDDEDFRKTFAEVVPHEVERINTIVSRLLDFARPKPVSFGVQYLRPIIDQVLALIENQLRKAAIVVHEEFPEEQVRIYGDEQQLHQVFLNLFLNATDAMKGADGGTLGIHVYFDRAPLRQGGRRGAYREMGCVRIVVSDTGCGIAQEHIEQLFTPFFTTKAEGCGLGLSVVHGIVTEHGGEIDVTSSPDVGTSFTVTLPLTKAGQRSIEDAAEPVASH